MIKKIFFTFLLVVNLFLTSAVFGQAVGDYRSNVNTTGIWASNSNWEYYNGSIWVAATNYPGQIAGNYAVLIQAGDVINIGTAGITTQTMGTLTINGSLVLTGTNTGGVGTNFIFETQSIIVTPLLGTITFIDKVNLKLPTNAILQVKFDLTPNPDYYGLIGDCNHNQDIIIGSSTYAYCNGGGSTGLTFYEVMGGGGTLNSVPSYNSPICYGDTIMLYGIYIGPIGNGITYTWTIIDPNGTSSTIIAKDTSLTNAIAGNYIVKLTCSTVYGSVAYSNSETITVTVNPLPTTPTIGTITQPTCALSTGSVILSGLPASGTWTLTRSPGAATTTGTGTSTTISGLTSGTYTYTVSNASCTSGDSNSVVINETTNTWSGSGWSTGSPPPTVNGTQILVFNTPFISSTDLSGCSCQANADVLIKYGHTLTLTNGLTVDSAANMVFEDTASLVQINDVSNTGVIEYNRDTKSRNSDYTYWSSPVYSLQSLGGVSGLFPDSLAGTFYSFDSSINPADWKNEPSGTPMTVGKGYIARGPEDLGNQTPPETPFTTTFNGVPNNGTINVPILHSGASDGTSNLIGNPYPSAINADLFLAANSAAIEGTLYFWTHNTEIGVGTIELGSGLYPYTGNDYASYNGTGGAAGSGGKIPTGKIAAGQGFFATSYLANGIATFTNAMRLAGTTLSDGKGVNQQFFKKRNSKTEKVIEKNRLWLNLTNTQGAFKQTLIGYITNATNDYDDRFDGESFDGNEFVDFYSVNQDKNLVIQGRALPFNENDEVPLGYRTTINGAFTINIDQVDGLLTNQVVFVEDKLTNTVTDLKSGNYTFNTVAGTFNDRFVLRYTNTNSNKTLATNNFDSLENKVLVSNKNKQIKINSFAETIDKVTIYDLLGRQIYQKDKVNSNELSIANLVSSRQTLVVKTVLQNGETVTNKIVY